MIPTPLDPQYKVRANMRPLKHAYFVGPEDQEGLIKAIRSCCTQWGGIRNIIIPLTQTFEIEPFFCDLLRCHEPDVFVEYVGRPDEYNFDVCDRLRDRLKTIVPGRTISVHLSHEFFERDTSAHVLTTVATAQKLKGQVVIHEFSDRDADFLNLLTLFGVIYDGQEAFYKDALQLVTQEMSLGHPKFWDYQLTSSYHSSVLNWTSFRTLRLSVDGFVEGGAPTIFDIVLVNSVVSACAYWNLRAIREAQQFEDDPIRRTLLLPERLLNDQESLRHLLELIRSNRNHPYYRSNLDLKFIACTSDDAKKLAEHISKLPELKPLRGSRITIDMTPHKYDDSSEGTTDLSYLIQEVNTSKPYHSSRGLPRLPITFREGIRRDIAVNTKLDYGSNEIYLAPPDEFNAALGTIALDIETDLWNRYPQNQQVANLVSQGAWFSRYGLSFISSFQGKACYLSFNVPDELETIRKYFAQFGYEARISKPGEYGSAVVELLGGMDEVRLIASKPAHKLLDGLAMKSTKKIAQRIARDLRLNDSEIGDIQKILVDVEAIPELKGVTQTYGKLKNGLMQEHRKGLLTLLDKLSKKQILKRGFHFPCPRCGTPSWYPLLVVKEIITCAGCSSDFPLPIEYPAGSEIEWEYTLNSLVNRAMDQDVLPAIYALHNLTSKSKSCCVVPGVEIAQSNEVKAEFDFFFVSQQRTFAGECKAGTELGDKDIKTARFAASLGIATFYFCTVQEFSDESKLKVNTFVSELKSSGNTMEIGLMSGKDLLRDDF